MHHCRTWIHLWKACCGLLADALGSGALPVDVVVILLRLVIPTGSVFQTFVLFSGYLSLLLGFVHITLHPK